MSDAAVIAPPATEGAGKAGAETVLASPPPAPPASEPSAEVSSPPEFDWRAALAAGDEKALKRFERYSDPAAAGRAFLELERERREGVVPRPKADWSEEQYAKFYSELGRPETADQYEIKATPPEDAPANARELIEARLADARQAAHDAGLSPKQWERLSKYVHDSVTGELRAAQQEAQAYQAQVVRQLKSDWGPEYDENLRWANQALNEFSRETGFDAPNMLGLTVMVDGRQVRLGDYAPFIKFATAVGRRFGDDPVFLEAVRNSAGSDPVAGMEKRLADILALAQTDSRAYDERKGEAAKLAAAIERAKGRGR